MIIVIMIAAICLIGYAFSAAVRGYINAAAMNIAAFVVNITPTWRVVLITLGVIVALPFILGASWIGFWVMIGNWATSPTAGLVIGIGSLVGIFAFRWLVRPLIAIAAVLIVFGLLFPTLKKSLNNYSESGQVELSNTLNGAALQMNPDGVMEGVVIADTNLYSDNGNLTSTAAARNTKFKTISLERRQFRGSPETFAKVMLANIAGDFINGSTGWIPVRKVRLGTTFIEETPPPAAGATNLANTQQPEPRVQATTEKLGDYCQYHPGKPPRCLLTKINALSESELRMDIYFTGKSVQFNGTRAGDCYTSSWQNPPPDSSGGKIELCPNSDGTYNGTEYSGGKPLQVSFKLRA